MKVKMFEGQFNFGSRIIQTKREPWVEFPPRKIGLQDVKKNYKKLSIYPIIL